MNTKVRYDHYYNKEPQFEYKTYKNQFTDPATVIPERPVTCEIQRHFLFVSSAERDRTRYASPARFTVNLPDNYWNVVSIELIAGVLPNLDSIADDPFLLLDLGDDMNHIQSLDNRKWFAFLNVVPHPNPAFLNLDKSNTDDIPVFFRPPKEKLRTLSIHLLHADQSTVDFGTEDAQDPIDTSLQTHFIFEIKTFTPQTTFLTQSLPTFTNNVF